MEKICNLYFEDAFTATIMQKIELMDSKSTNYAEIEKFADLLADKLIEKGVKTQIIFDDISIKRFFKEYGNYLVEETGTLAVKDDITDEDLVGIFPVGSWSLTLLETVLDDKDIGKKAFGIEDENA